MQGRRCISLGRRRNGPGVRNCRPSNFVAKFLTVTIQRTKWDVSSTDKHHDATSPGVGVIYNDHRKRKWLAKERLIFVTWGKGGGEVERLFEAPSLWKRHFVDKRLYKAPLKFFNLKYIYQEFLWSIEIKLILYYWAHFRWQSHWKWKLNHWKGNVFACAEGQIISAIGNFGVKVGKIRFVFDGSHPNVYRQLFLYISTVNVKTKCIIITGLYLATWDPIGQKFDSTLIIVLRVGLRMAGWRPKHVARFSPVVIIHLVFTYVVYWRY